MYYLHFIIDGVELDTSSQSTLRWLRHGESSKQHPRSAAQSTIPIQEISRRRIYNLWWNVWSGFLLRTCNATHSSIKFTLECESNMPFAFLDVLLTRRHDHGKPTWSEQFTNFWKFIPRHQKRTLNGFHAYEYENYVQMTVNYLWAISLTSICFATGIILHKSAEWHMLN